MKDLDFDYNLLAETRFSEDDPWTHFRSETRYVGHLVRTFNVLNVS